MAQTYHKLRTYRGPREDRDEILVEEDNLAAATYSNPVIVKTQLIVQFILGIILSLLAVRFLLALFGANEANAFVDFIYGITAPLVAPFQGLFNISASSGVARFEFETVFAGLIYLIVGAGIIKLLDIFKSREG